ncbi:MAG TPA: redoxin domain-containing protein, partial [Candidatus Bathyarchaeia archaeon]
MPQKVLLYAALSQHYDRKHSAARKPTYLENMASAEREAEFKSRARPYKSGRSVIKLTVFALILIIAVGVIAYAALNPPTTQRTKAIDVGSVAPDFTLTDTLGGTFTLSEYKGSSNVLLFFNEGLACSPCLQQMQSMDQLNQQFSGLNVVVASIT